MSGNQEKSTFLQCAEKPVPKEVLWLITTDAKINIVSLPPWANRNSKRICVTATKHGAHNRVYLPTLRHYAWVSRLRTKDINLTHRGQFLTPDSQIRTSCSLTHNYDWKPFGLNIFGNVRTSSGNLRKWLLLFGNPSHDETKISHIWLKKLAGTWLVLVRFTVSQW